MPRATVVAAQHAMTGSSRWTFPGVPGSVDNHAGPSAGVFAVVNYRDPVDQHVFHPLAVLLGILEGAPFPNPAWFEGDDVGPASFP